MGRFVLSTKEHLVLLRPTDGMLALQTLYYPEDVRLRDKQEIVERLKGVEVSDDELAMAEQLVEGLAKPFDPEAYPNQTRAALLEFLQAKADGQEVAEPEEAAAPAPVIDLMAALKASLAASGGRRRRRRGGGGAGEPEKAPAKKKPAARGRAKPKSDDQLDIEQSRLRKVEGGGEKPARKASAKKPAASRRKAS